MLCISGAVLFLEVSSRRTETSFSPHMAQPGTQSSKDCSMGIGDAWCVSLLAVEAVQVGVLLSPQWGAEGTLHIAQDLLTQQPEAEKFRQEHRCSCNEPSDLVSHSSPKQPLLM